MSQECMQYDVIIVGAGPAGLAAAIKLKQLSIDAKQDLSVCLLEKGAQIGNHAISGAVIDIASLKELLPYAWEQAPLNTAVNQDLFYYLTAKRAFRLPTPKLMQNHGNYIISLSELCRFLAAQATELGCEIYPGFPATDILYNEHGVVIGVATGEVGLDKIGHKKSNYQPGMHLHAKQIIFAEGCRGELSERLIRNFALRKHKQSQTYAIGIKETWQIKPQHHRLGQVLHTIGWPLNNDTYGGSFVYHFSDNRVSLGFVIGLDYRNPWLNPFEELQRFKTHAFIAAMLQDGERIEYGARALNEGGWQSIPKLTFPGGMLIGDSAGFLNVPKIKGIHNAIQSAQLAAEACFAEFNKNQFKNTDSMEIINYQERVNTSALNKELYAVRNIRPGFRYGLWFGLMNAAFESYLACGKTPWTMRHNLDYQRLIPATKASQIIYPKPDGKLTFDKASSVYLSNTYHEENQPNHIQLLKPAVAIEINHDQYASPEIRYCPAGVYEIIETPEMQPLLQINAQNCIHCKTCDIKDPCQNIIWHAPEGGGGPNYQSM